MARASALCLPALCLPALRLLLGLLLTLGVGRVPAQGLEPDPDWPRALALALEGAPQDSGQAAALRGLVDQGLAGGTDPGGGWACLDLWLRAEWEDDSRLPEARAAFLKDWPCSPCQTAADWWSARWVLRRLGPEAAAPRLLRLAAGRPESEWSARAARLLDQLADEALTDSVRLRLEQTADRADRDWWRAHRQSRGIRGRLLLVVPLSGPDAAVGQALKLGVEGALEQARAAGSPCELVVWDCQSDPLLTREQLTLCAAQAADAVLLPGLPGYLAATTGLELAVPVLALGYEGPAPASLNRRLLHFGLDPASVGALAAELARDSLRAGQVGTLGPATRASMRLVDGFEGWLNGRAPAPELGQKQWYFFGARHLERQLENLLLFQGGSGAPGVWLVLGSPREGPALAEALAAAPAGVHVVGDTGLLEALGNRVPASLAGRLLILTDWLPAEVADLAGPAGTAGWQAFRSQVQARQGRGPNTLESRSYESVRLLLLAAERARRSGRGLERELGELREPSLFAGSLKLGAAQAEGPLLLGWTGREYRVLGRRTLAERTR
ncbi:MAG: ABC transporter substrate-binding protein [Candidatus Delongbacteria bacterium]